jgi:hypothetical protein
VWDRSAVYGPKELASLHNKAYILAKLKRRGEARAELAQARQFGYKASFWTGSLFLGVVAVRHLSFWSPVFYVCGKMETPTQGFSAIPWGDWVHPRIAQEV